jgi:hypothetical protein
MGWPDAPESTDAQKLLNQNEYFRERQDEMIDALNGLGANVQWIVDNVKGIFQMFGSPQFMSMMGQMATGGIPSAGSDDAGDAGESAGE